MSIADKANNCEVQQHYKMTIENTIFIASIIDIAGFGLTALIGMVGIVLSRSAINCRFFTVFYCLIMLISFLQITIGVLNLVQPAALLQNNQLLFTQQLINNFSLVLQLGLVLAIAYDWSVLTSKLKETYQHTKKRFRIRRLSYIIMVVTLLVILAIVTTGIAMYSALKTTTLPITVDIIELVVYFATLIGAVVQVCEGYQLEKVVTQYRKVIGAKGNKWRFNLVYVGAFLLGLIRSGVQIGRLIYIISTGNNSDFWSSLTYFILYTLFELIPIVLYLVGIQVQRPRDDDINTIMRDSVISDTSHRTSSLAYPRQTELT